MSLLSRGQKSSKISPENGGGSFDVKNNRAFEIMIDRRKMIHGATSYLLGALERVKATELPPDTRAMMAGKPIIETIVDNPAKKDEPVSEAVDKVDLFTDNAPSVDMARKHLEAVFANAKVGDKSEDLHRAA